MKNMKRGLCYLAVLAVSLFTLASCSCTQGTCGGITEPEPTPMVVVPDSGRDIFLNQHVHFAYDSFALSSQAESILDNKALWLRANPNVQFTVEGHCDERGTEEYNLALGDRRANVVKKYLVDSGIDSRRIRTISYGEERPLDGAHNERAWAKNRRAQFIIR